MFCFKIPHWGSTGGWHQQWARGKGIFASQEGMAVHRERHTRGYVYVVSDRFSRTSYACERVRPIAAAIRASASRADDAVSASQLHAHAAGRVGGLLKSLGS